MDERVIARVPRFNNEVVQVAVSEFGGRLWASIRSVFTDQHGCRTLGPIFYGTWGKVEADFDDLVAWVKMAAAEPGPMGAPRGRLPNG